MAAISFDLVAEAEELDGGSSACGCWSAWPCSSSATGVVERRFGSRGPGGAMGIVVGSVVDGVPESIIFGIQLATGLPVSAGFLAAS